MPKLVAALLVFACSAAVLVLEILAGRLLAPYVGISLETYTAVIGTILAGIAAGSWLGGRAADRLDPRRLLGPLVLAGGGLALLTVPVVRTLGHESAYGGVVPTLTLAVSGFFLPAAILSAVTPTVVKLQLRDLGQTGGVVGQLSGIGTLGALVGTFVTGFLLVAKAPTRAVIYGVGVALVAVGIALWAWLSRRDVAALGCIAALAVGGSVLTATVDEPCQVESAYYCMRVTRDPDRASGRTLWLDNLEHSYVDLKDPAYLDFGYTISIADTVAVAVPGTKPIDALFIGGGGFTLPRYFTTTRPGSRSTVLEIDPAVEALAREKLGLTTGPAVRVRIGDARIGIRGTADRSVDLVVGDAFGSLSVPWHLTTREFLGEIHRVLRPGGIYAMNAIDYPPYHFVRAELATLRRRFAWVGVIAAQAQIDGSYGGNLVLLASDRPVEPSALASRVATHATVLLEGARLDAFVGGARELTDDYAPVDQLLTSDRPR